MMKKIRETIKPNYKMPKRGIELSTELSYYSETLKKIKEIIQNLLKIKFSFFFKVFFNN